MTTWQRVEVADPIFRKVRGRERQTALITVGDEVMRVRRVLSPTVAYVERAAPLEAWAWRMEDRSTPFLRSIQQGA